MRNVEDKIARALGKKPVDLLLANARIVNVFSGEIFSANIAIVDGRIIGFGNYEAIERIDLEGSFISPSFIDGHIHIESSYLTIPEFPTGLVLSLPTHMNSQMCSDSMVLDMSFRSVRIFRWIFLSCCHRVSRRPIWKAVEPFWDLMTFIFS